MRAFSSTVWFSRVVALIGVLSGCSSAAAPADGGASTGDAHVEQDADVPTAPETLGPAERPAQLVTPRAFDGVTPLPAVFLLHGFGASGAIQDAYFGLSRAARSRGFYVVLPDGTLNSAGRRFWNATPACCDFERTGVDDVAYLTSLIDELEAAVPVSGVYFVGHSNGGFMSYRMACERSSRIRAIVSLAGSDYLNDDDCVPDESVSVLQIHGDLDDTILYAGSGGAYPSAADVVARWATRAGCDTSMSVAGDMLDLEGSIVGSETEVLRYEAGCTGDQAELWSIRGGGHIPGLSAEFMPAVLDWLIAH